MPIYVYECDNCQHGFEEIQSFKDDALVKCPECKKKKLRRVPQLFMGTVAVRTLGALADRNAAIMSDDAKHASMVRHNDKIGLKREQQSKTVGNELDMSKFKSKEQVNNYIETGKLPS